MGPTPLQQEQEEVGDKEADGRGTLQQGVQVPKESDETVGHDDSEADRVGKVESSQGPRRSARIRALQMQQGLTAGAVEKRSHDHGMVTDLCYSAELQEPLTLQQAMSSPDHMEWRAAISDEMQSLKENRTWDLCELPKGRKAVSCKWVFKLKDLPDGGTKHKARLVARGFSQVEGVDFDETYAPVVRYQSLRMMIAIANEEQMHLHQMDVKTAFLYGDLEEEIYMHQPEEQAAKGEEGLVCRLRKSLYGLKQSPRCWNTKIDAFLASIGFSPNFSDAATYTKGSGDQQVLLGLYVDDMTIMSKSLEAVEAVKKLLSAEFKMEDFGEASVVLKIRIRRDKERGILTLDQSKYAASVLQRFGMQDCKGVSIPLSHGTYFSVGQSPDGDEEKEQMSAIPYRQAVGSLMYLMVSTRPDIAAAVQVLSRFGSNPGPAHWSGVKRVLQYVQRTINFGLVFKRGQGVTLSGFCDADFSSCLDTSRSTGGYVFSLGGAAVSWSSKRQPVVAQSTCEAEYMAMNQAARDAVWGSHFLQELGWTQGPVVILSDSQSALSLTKNPVIGPKSKHIRRQFHYVRDCLDDGDVCLRFIGTDQQVADALTKSLPRDKLEFCRAGMGVLDVTTALSV